MLTSGNHQVKSKTFYADLSLVIVALTWGGGFVVLKDALNNISPLNIMAIRFTLAFLLLALIFITKLKSITKQELIAGSIIGGFLFAAFATQTVGLKYTTAGKQAFLTGANVVIVPFLAWFVHKKAPDRYSIIGAFLTLIGIGLLTLQGSLSMNLGDALTLFAAIFYAAHIVSVGYFTRNADPIILTIIQIGVAAIIFILCALIFEPIPQEINKSVVMAVGYLVLFSTVVAFLIQNVAQKLTPATHAAIILSLESVFGALLAVWILHDKFTVKMILGCLCIFLAIIITETKLSFLTVKTKVSCNNQVKH